MCDSLTILPNTEDNSTFKLKKDEVANYLHYITPYVAWYDVNHC